MNGDPGLVDTQPPLLGCFHRCLPAVGAQPDEARTARGGEGQLPRAPFCVQDLQSASSEAKRKVEPTEYALLYRFVHTCVRRHIEPRVNSAV